MRQEFDCFSTTFDDTMLQLGDTQTIRHEGGHPVSGLIVTATKA